MTTTRANGPSRRIGGTVFADKMDRGRHLSYQRSRHVTKSSTSLIKIEGVDDTNAARYVGNRLNHTMMHPG